ncbi:MAG: glycosyltransferase family 9 protein [Candidatus Baltobacteraceae bacterium]
MTDSSSALIVRLDALGDTLALAPLLLALREAAVPIDLVLSPAARDLFAAEACRSAFLSPFAQRDESAANRSAIAAFADVMRENRYSHVLVATEDPAGYRLAAALRAPHRIGFQNGWGKPLKTLWVRSLLTQTIFRSAGLDPRAPHECEVLFSLGASLLPPGARPARDAMALRRLLLAREPAPQRGIALQLTSKWERLGMTVADVRAFLDRAHERVGAIRLLAPVAERAQISALAEGLDGIEWFDDLQPWIAAIAESELLVAPDSGAIHIAGTVGTPCVAIFQQGPDFELQRARWRPWAAPSVTLEGNAGWPQRALSALQSLRESSRT